MEIVSALLVSLRVTLMASLAILVVGLPLALYLARATGRLRHIVEALILLPMLLPPTVVGYLLLVVLGRGSPLVEVFGIHLLFTGYGAAAAGALVGLPLMVFTSRAAIGSVDRRLEDVARTLGASEMEVLFDITFPLAARGIAAGMLLGFARATGEFGATLMVAGSIPRETRTLSIALYEAVQLGEDSIALGLVILLMAVVVIVVTLLRLIEKDWLRWRS